MRSVYGGVAMELVVTQVFGWVGWGRAGWRWVGGGLVVGNIAELLYGGVSVCRRGD
jgi:hypothetical protein